MSEPRVYVVEWGGTKGRPNTFGWWPNSAWTEFRKAQEESKEMKAAHPDQKFRVKRYEPA